MPIAYPDLWTVAALVLALIGIAATMTSVPGPGHWEFGIARLCFVAAALLFLGKATVWGAADLTLIRVAIVGLIGAALAVGLAFGVQWVNKKQNVTKPAETAKSAAGPPIQEVSILADCSHGFLPAYVPPDGIIMRAFVAFDDEASRVKIVPMDYSGQPGAMTNWLALKQSPTGWKCELTSQQTIFDVELALDATIIENIRKPDPTGQISNYSGMPLGRVQASFTRHRIDSNSTVFYLINQSSYFINIEIRRIASGNIINKFGGHERRIDIPVNALRYASMGPFIINTPPTIPPVPPHPDQAQQHKQETK